ncbi:polynucleotide 5'-hydroxyl-kinase NOL9 [Micropterus salmoides]|uniref:polynucleotide 5'-hydroxyl-kinase NOL9 n=1 Tax=Micropterus salmoides TaxID=27706 RepID=UPI0018EB2904|nr:polynucleotide 5'-hydroxyl-kinase NOL9 [Micropterus salmoides]XP_038577808.1 polynucleotide 5'-hydroxyl-kinase NOL9 [Micropterus salmoides]XP_038577809.1 polynucleotide 5'-hydroxyl-kinase NOL9 [Micropterus salmoides]XP_045912391.1 polynucleotide 5'-hydroxyl-kinase NOL9 [Micropterus dolomieu]XP_045912392.1 polynucleotide 5'-hydroxyl-kinase NOL9 [Micropterus dolomieu]XP_045912393.1 polynucleotide 5'-hydroxyl-kinase NOL9 [Micropterus dolomieu]XP_045912394.1 polynucleotide 5'-hydroxyl-kinase N
MKVNKPTQVRGHAKSQKWKDVRGKRSRPPISSSELKSSPVMARAIREHQASVKKKPTLKRLQSKPKSVSDSKKKTAQSGVKKSHTQANGSSAFTIDNESEDSQDWKEYSQSIHRNGVETSGYMEDVKPSRLEGDALHHCAQRDDRQNHAVLVMQKNQTLCFRGKCSLTCLYGRVEVMGFTIEEGQQSYPLFSPATHCPLTIRALESSDHTRDDRTEASPILRKYLPSASRKKLLKRIMPSSSIILLEPMETPLTRFLSSFTDLTELFSPPMSELMSAVLDTPLNGLGMIPLVSAIEGLKMPKSYSDALNTVVSACRGDMDGCAVILVCGTKNVGKSTFIRILINTLLNHTSSVDYLEGDLGQTEFTPAGCLSLSTVREPLLGPPFTHQFTPDHMIYYGHSSCESDLDRYLESLKSLWRRRSKSRETPVIINTMGWVKGFGFQMLVDMVRFFPVSHVVQLSHSGIMQCPALTPEFLRTAHGYQTHPPAQTALDEFTESHSPPRSYTHLIVQSEFQGVGRQGTAKHQRTNELRELSLLAYLSQLQSSDPGPVRPLHSLTPYQVPHTAVALGVIHCEVVPSHMFYAANASLVGLCCLGEKVTSRGGPVLLSQAPICPCVGFGVLRGIDTERGLYFLLTPVDPSILRKVNCLLLGAISLPSCILTTQPGFEGEMPYVTTDYSFDLSGAGKMRVFKGLMRPSHIGM